MSDILLQEQDEKFLAEKGYVYSLTTEENSLFLVISNFPFPQEFYELDQSDIYIKILPGYPITNLDMFWTNPEVKLKNGQLPAGTISAQEEHFGKKWQRWSRHYTNPWRPGVDNLRSFIQSINIELRKGI